MVSRFLSSLLFLAAVSTRIAQAQVIPDGTLPTVVEQLENPDNYYSYPTQTLTT